MLKTTTMDGLAAHLKETTASTAGLEGTLDEPVGRPVTGALAAVSLLLAASGVVWCVWKLGGWLLA